MRKRALIAAGQPEPVAAPRSETCNLFTDATCSARNEKDGARHQCPPPNVTTAHGRPPESVSIASGASLALRTANARADSAPSGTVTTSADDHCTVSCSLTLVAIARQPAMTPPAKRIVVSAVPRSEEHTSELQSLR